MQLDIRRLISRSCLRGGVFLAGKDGAANPVRGVTVLEISDLSETGGEVLSVKPGDLILTAFNDIKSDVAKQRLLIRRMSACGVSGLVLFYVGQVVKSVDESVLRLCDELGLPLLRPRGDLETRLSYADVIADVTALLMEDDRRQRLSDPLVNALIALLKAERPLEDALTLLAKKTGCTVGVFDENRLAIAQSGPDARILQATLGQSTEQALLKGKAVGPSRCQFRRVRTLGACLWTGVLAPCEAGEDQRQALPLLKLTVELWADELGERSEGELLRAIIRREPGAITRLAAAQRLDLGKIRAFAAVSAREGREAFSAFHDRLAGLRDLYGTTYLSGTFKKIRFYLFFRPGRDALWDEFLAEATGDRLFATPVLLCRLLSERDLLQTVPAAAGLFPDLAALYRPKQVVNKQDLLLLSHFLARREAGKDGEDGCLDMLRRLEEYDAKNGSELTGTMVDCVLYADLNYRAVAQKRFVHYNTILYRMRKVEELLFLDLKKPGDLAVLTAVALAKAYQSSRENSTRT